MAPIPEQVASMITGDPDIVMENLPHDEATQNEISWYERFWDEAKGGKLPSWVQIKSEEDERKLKFLLQETVLVSDILPGALPGTRILKKRVRELSRFLHRFGGITKRLGSGVEGAAYLTGYNAVVKYYWPHISLDDYFSWDIWEDKGFQPYIEPYSYLNKIGPIDGVIEVFDTYQTPNDGVFSFALVAIEYLEPVDEKGKKRVFDQSPEAKKFYKMITRRDDPSYFTYSGWSDRRQQWVIFDLIQ